jgi:hypothetical protein
MKEPDEYTLHVQAIEARRDELIGEAEALQARTWRRLEAAGISRSTVDACARSLGSPPANIPFGTIFEALAERLSIQASEARALAAEWAQWDRRVNDLEDEAHARALCLESDPSETGRPC